MRRILAALIFSLTSVPASATVIETFTGAELLTIGGLNPGSPSPIVQTDGSLLFTPSSRFLFGNIRELFPDPGNFSIRLNLILVSGNVDPQIRVQGGAPFAGGRVLLTSNGTSGLLEGISGQSSGGVSSTMREPRFSLRDAAPGTSTFDFTVSYRDIGGQTRLGVSIPGLGFSYTDNLDLTSPSLSLAIFGGVEGQFRLNSATFTDFLAPAPIVAASDPPVFLLSALGLVFGFLLRYKRAGWP